jgi:hypothetical protein
MEERVPYKHKVVVRFCHLLYTLCNIHEVPWVRRSLVPHETHLRCVWVTLGHRAAKRRVQRELWVHKYALLIRIGI